MDAGDILAYSGEISGELEEDVSSKTKKKKPFLPGAVTATEVIAAKEAGFRILKFFPAGTSGGAAAIKAFSGPFGDLQFVPTGGVNIHNANDYLSLPNVRAVGGTWLTPSDAINAERWDDITHIARDASQLGA